MKSLIVLVISLLGVAHVSLAQRVLNYNQSHVSKDHRWLLAMDSSECVGVGVSSASFFRVHNKLFLFYGSDRVMLIKSEDNGNSWSAPIQVSKVIIGKVASIIHKGNDVSVIIQGEINPIYNDSMGYQSTLWGKGITAITYSITSHDIGYTWAEPKPIIKHNTLNLIHPQAIRASRKAGKVRIVLEDSHSHDIFYSYENDSKAGWSYPEKISPRILKNITKHLKSCDKLYSIERL